MSTYVLRSRLQNKIFLIFFCYSSSCGSRGCAIVAQLDDRDAAFLCVASDVLGLLVFFFSRSLPVFDSFSLLAHKWFLSGTCGVVNVEAFPRPPFLPPTKIKKNLYLSFLFYFFSPIDFGGTNVGASRDYVSCVYIYIYFFFTYKSL